MEQKEEVKKRAETQTFKRHAFFDLEQWEEKKVIINKPAQDSITADSANQQINLPCIQINQIVQSQGIAAFGDTWYILGTVPEAGKSVDEGLNYLVTYKKEAAPNSTLSSIVAHEKNFGIKRAEADKMRYIITLGEDKLSVGFINSGGKKLLQGQADQIMSVMTVKIWKTDSLVSDSYSNMQDYGKREKEVPRILYPDVNLVHKNISAFAVSQDLTHLCIGLDSGDIILMQAIQGNSNLATANDKEITNIRLKQESLENFYVSNIYLTQNLEKNKNSYTLYYTTNGGFFKYKLQTKKRTFTGIAKEAVETNGMDGSGNNIAMLCYEQKEIHKYEGSKLIGKWPIKELGRIKVHENNIMMITVSDKMECIKIYDLESEILAYAGNVNRVLAEAVMDGNFYFFIQGSKDTHKIFQIVKEKTNVEKLEKILKAKQFDVAYNFAKKEKFAPEVLADISKYQADFLLSKGMFAEAISKYKNTVGFLNPSYVIQKFLDVQRLENLTEYLEELTQHSQNNLAMIEEHKYYTALLLNCYVKQGGDKLKNLITRSTFEEGMLDTDTAIEVCKESKKLDCALLLAQKANNLDQQLRIHIENYGKFDEALKLINNIYLKIDFEKKEKKERESADDIKKFDTKLLYLRRFGPVLIKAMPNETYQIIEETADMLIKKRNEDSNQGNTKYIQQFKWMKEIFVDNPEMNKRFLDFQIKQDQMCDKEVYHSLIEWHLQDYFEVVKSDAKHENILNKKIKDPLLEKKKENLLNMLKSFKEKYDKNHVLMLLEMYQVSEGVKLLCEMLERKNELMTYYMQNKEYASIMQLCGQYGEVEQNLWIQALTFFVSEVGSETGKAEAQMYIIEILKLLKNVQSISPLLVLEIISKNKGIKFSVLKDYLADKLSKLQKNIEKNRTSVEQIWDEIEKVKKNMTSLRTSSQVFQLSNCSTCKDKLELPFIHFMCNHSFHEGCIDTESQIKECPNCSGQHKLILDKKAQLLSQLGNHEQFNKELSAKDKKFDVVAEYFGRGLFSSINNHNKEEGAENANEEQKE